MRRRHFGKKTKRDTVTFDEMVQIADTLGVAYEQAFVSVIAIPIEHCCSVFHEARNQENTDTDNLSLHLAFYLASWGMYRGSSFCCKRTIRYIFQSSRNC